MASAERTGTSAGRRTAQQPSRAAQGTAPLQGQPEILLEQGFDDESLYGVRAAVAAHVSTVADGRTVDVMVLIAHELASNAVRHGGGAGRLRLWLADRALHCEITDGGAGLADPALAGRRLPAPSLPGGRGLWIARQLSELRIVTSAAGTTVTSTVTI